VNVPSEPGDEGLAIRADADRPAPALRRLWDRLPSVLRRPVVRLMGSERIRLRVLDHLGIRDANAFFPLSNGGPMAIDASMKLLKTHEIAGDYYEFGLFRGFTLWHAQQAADHAGITTMRFFGFDSFQGLPKIEGNDRKAGIFISGDYRCARDWVEQTLTDHGFDWSRGTLIEGFFDDSLTPALKVEHSMGRAALVMVDCDLYQSTVPVLSFLDDVLQDGTILLFDDWYCFGEDEGQGEPRAFREFLQEHPEWSAERFITFPTYGQAFIMRPSPN